MNRQPSPTGPIFHRVESIPFDGHLVLVKDHRELIALNETARLLWEALADGATVADLAREMTERFGLSRDHARADIETALAEWRARGLIGHEPGERRSAPRQSILAATPPSDFDLDRTYAVCGLPVRFRVQDPDAASLLCPLLSPSEVVDASASETIDLYRDGVHHVIAANGAEIGRSRRAEEALGLAIGRVLEVSYPDARWLAVFHAGAIANQHHAIVMPAASGSGKSTLTAALVHSGLRYLSDDVVPLDGRTLRVLPVPLASSLKRGSWPVLASRFADLAHLPTYRDGRRQRRYLDLSASAHDMAGVPVRAIVFPQYRTVGPTTVQALRPGQALESVLKAGCWVSLDRGDLTEMLQWMLATPAYALQYSSVDDAVSTIDRMLLE